MNSKQRVEEAINHRQPDIVPLDLGGSSVTGMSVISVYALRQALQLDPPGTPVKVIEPFQMLGEVQTDLLDALEVDVVSLARRKNMFGYENTNWKPWFFHNIPVLVPEKFNTKPEPNGDLYMYPEGDPSASPSAIMPKGNYYFNSLNRQKPIEENTLNPADNMEEFTPISDDDVEYLKLEANRLTQTTERAVLANFGGMGFGDIALVPAPWLKNPKGIRDVAEWYMSTVSRVDYVYKVFEHQCTIALQNLPKIYSAVGNIPTVIFVSGTDFGSQSGPLISPKTYRKLYKPFLSEINQWIHKHTQWKTFIHSCGSVAALIADFIETGFDILNPVQTSAAGMDPAWLKNEYGKDIVFWGGGIDTQYTLPFGTPEEIHTQVKERMEIFGKSGGFVFNTIHNVQARIPVKNLITLYQSIKELRQI